MKPKCPAGNATCRVCGKLGHFERGCKMKKKEGKDAMVDVVVASAQVEGQPRLQILVSQATSDTQHRATAVANTGAQVCVAGPTLMKPPGLTPSNLHSRRGVRDLVNDHLPTLGASSCRISVPAALPSKTSTSSGQ